MLTASDIRNIAEENDLVIHEYAGIDADGPPARISIFFDHECPDAWFSLMTNATVVPVRIFGTRIVSGSGAIDGALKDPYAQLLKQVNDARRKIGLDIVLN